MKKTLFVIIGVCFFLFSCSEEEKKVNEKLIPVTVVKVEKKEITIPLITSGKVSAEFETVLSFKTGGIVRKILVKEGQSVKLGEQLAQLDLSEINAQVKKAEEGYNKANRDFVRVESLYEDSVVTLEQYQNTETALSIATSNLDIAKFNLNYSQIKAPADGKIFRKLVEENQIISPGMPVILFGKTSEAWLIKIGISDKYISKFSIGDKAIISLDAFPTNTFPGKISEISSFAEPMSGTYEIEVSFNTSENIISGMIANVELFSSEKISGYLLPINTLVDVDGDNASIYIPNKNKKGVERIDVKVGEIVGQKVFVTSFAKILNEVIQDGVEYVSESSKINIVKYEN